MAIRSDRDKIYLQETMEKAQETFVEAVRLQKELNEMDKKYTGWSRFFAVPGGHIHSSMNCHTCNKSWVNPTQFQWMPQLSGKSDETAVKEQGAYLCTICYPDAPTEWTNGYEQAEAEKAATECPGSGTWDYSESRTGYFAGNWGLCKHCNERITVSKTGKMRRHEPK